MSRDCETIYRDLLQIAHDISRYGDDTYIEVYVPEAFLYKLSMFLFGEYSATDVRITHPKIRFLTQHKTYKFQLEIPEEITNDIHRTTDND